MLLISDSRGKIRSLNSLEAAGMKGGLFFKLDRRDFIKLPAASRLFMLPGRAPVGYDAASGNFVVLGDYFAVAAFVSPGYTVTYNTAYKETKRPSALPLFSYAAVSFYNDEFYAAAVRVDKRHCHDPKFIDLNLVRKNTVKMARDAKANRFCAARQLEKLSVS